MLNAYGSGNMQDPAGELRTLDYTTPTSLPAVTQRHTTRMKWKSWSCGGRRNQHTLCK